MSKKELTKKNVIAFIQSNWDEGKVDEAFDEEVNNGNWLDYNWEEEYDEASDWYTDYGSGEAEMAVRGEIDKEVMAEFRVTYEQYSEAIGQELWDTVVELFPKLDS